MICSFNVAFSLHNFICFISEEMGSTTITKKLKSSLFIPRVMPGLSTLMPFCLVHEGPRGREFYPRVYVRPRSDNFVFTLYYQHLHQSSRALCSREQLSFVLDKDEQEKICSLIAVESSQIRCEKELLDSKNCGRVLFLKILQKTFFLGQSKTVFLGDQLPKSSTWNPSFLYSIFWLIKEFQFCPSRQVSTP